MAFVNNLLDSRAGGSVGIFPHSSHFKDDVIVCDSPWGERGCGDRYD